MYISIKRSFSSVFLGSYFMKNISTRSKWPLQYTRMANLKCVMGAPLQILKGFCHFFVTQANSVCVFIRKSKFRLRYVKKKLKKISLCGYVNYQELIIK